MRKFIACFIASYISLCIASSIAFAVDLGVESGRDQRLERDKTISTKSSTERRESSGKKESETTSTGTDQQSQDIIKKTSQDMLNSSLDMTLSLSDVFVQNLALLELSEPVLNYKLLTQPRQPTDFGLSAELGPGVIDSIKSDLLTKAAASNSLVATVGGNNQKIHKHKKTLALYGVIIGQAYLYLSADLEQLGNTGKKDDNGKIKIKQIGYDDLLVLAEGALLKAIKDIRDRRLKKIYQTIITDNTPCRFAGSITTIQCGSSILEVGSNPKLTALGMVLFSNGKYGGLEATYKVSSGWSYNQAIDELKTTSKYEKIAKEVSKYADSMIAKGKAKEALLAKKRTWSLAKSGKAGLSLGRLIPGIH